MCSVRIDLPQPRQRCWMRGAGSTPAERTVLPSPLVCGVASNEWEARPGNLLAALSTSTIDHGLPVSSSWTRAYARPIRQKERQLGPRFGAVCDSSIANALINRQFPSRCSKNHARFSGSRVIQSSRKASTCGSNWLHEIAGEAIASRSIRHARNRGRDRARGRPLPDAFPISSTAYK